MNKVTNFLISTTIFFIPAYLLKFNFFNIPTNLLEILIYFTFLSYLLEKPNFNLKLLYDKYRVYIFSIALLFIGLILSTLINKNYQIGFGIIKGWFFDPILFSFILINKIKSKEDINKILKILYFSAFTVSLIALEYFLYGKLTYDGRLEAFFNSPNFLAMFLAPAVIWGIYLLRNYDHDKRKNKVITVIMLIMIASIIYLTYSYTAWISIILSLIIVGLITKNINKKLILISFLIILIAFLTQLNNPKLKNMFSNRSSISSRIIIWKSSILILKDNFIFGIGPGNFQKKYLEYQKYFPPYLEWAVPEPHNLFLAFWLQGGLAGFISFLSLAIFLLKKIISEILKDQKNSHFTTVILCILFYILIHGILDTTYWKNDLALIFWIIFSLGLLTLEIDSKKLSISPVDKKQNIFGWR